MELMKSIIDENGLRVEIPMNKDEIADYEKRTADLIEKRKQESERAKAKASALAKLAALGLTEDEIAAL